MPRSLASASSLVLCGLLLTACSSSTSPQLYRPQVDASLLLPCVDPVLPPSEPSDNELAAFMVRQAKAYIDCRDRHGALIDRVKDDKPPETKKKGWFE